MALAVALAASSSAWAPVAPPATAAQWSCANASPQEWRVQRGAHGELVFAPASARAPDLVWRMPDGGRLVGSNQGEFGGSVDWVSDAGDQRVRLLEANAVAFTAWRGDIYIASGLSHLGLEHGEIHRMRQQGRGRWQIDKVLDLEQAPSAAMAKDEAWTLVTGTGLLRVDLRSLAIARVHENPQWWQVYPTSLLQRDGRWFIGARSAVIRLSPVGEGWREEWMLPPGCAAADRICGCTG